MRGTQQSRQLQLTIYNLFTLKPSIQSHTPYTQTGTSLTFIQTFSHIHHTHKLEPLSQSYRHSVTYTMHTNWNLSHSHTDIQSHTQYTKSRTSLTVIQTFSHIHHTHKLEPLSQPYRHSVTYTIHTNQNLSHSHIDIQSHTPYIQSRTSPTVTHVSVLDRCFT